MTTTPGPRTEAGKRFYDELIRPTHPITVGMDYARQRITEVEAEARADVPISVPVVWNFALPAEGTQPRADVDGLATPEGYAERYATGYEAGRKDAARDIRRAVMKLAYTTVDVTDTSEGWEAVPRASVLALVAPLLAGDRAEAPEYSPAGLRYPTLEELNTGVQDPTLPMLAGDKAEAPSDE